MMLASNTGGGHTGLPGVPVCGGTGGWCVRVVIAAGVGCRGGRGRCILAGIGASGISNEKLAAVGEETCFSCAEAGHPVVKMCVEMVCPLQ